MKNLLFYFMSLTLLVFTACNDDEMDDVSGKVTENISYYKGTQSPGDVWEWTLDHDNNTFTTVWDYGTFDDTSDDITIEGTYETLVTGYLKCTINNVSPANQDIPDDGSAYFYAMHLPGVAMIVKPEGSIKGDLIATVAAGDCADVAGNYNYILTAPGNGEAYDPATEEAYGEVSIVEQGEGVYAISGNKYSLDCANEGACTLNSSITGLPTASCTENGSVVIQSEDQVTAVEGQFTAAGVMMLDMGKGNGGVLAFKQSATYEFTDLVGHDMFGFAYMPNNNDEKTAAVQLTFEDNGELVLGNGAKINNIHTGELDADSVSLRIDGIADGMLDGDITFPGDLGTNFVGAMLSYEESRMLVVSSHDPEGSPFILVLIAK
ncbi:hypothetical protein [Marinoscillum sp. MHG1-6]|uniref:hypothetical protein n=1 Tax=Marinoscillum sp. MHG1-6 TaxID=2959627 RepID=UPI0021586702|nr:hypothetical protein [Marinoscillum sp. MHG1-6]